MPRGQARRCAQQDSTVQRHALQLIHVDTEPNVVAAHEARYPRAVDQIATPEPEPPSRPRWIAAIMNSLGLVAVIWSIPVAIVIVALPIALVIALVTWLTRP